MEHPIKVAPVKSASTNTALFRLAPLYAQVGSAQVTFAQVCFIEIELKSAFPGFFRHWFNTATSLSSSRCSLFAMLFPPRQGQNSL